MIKIEQRLHTNAFDCEGQMFSEIIENEQQVKNWLSCHELELFSCNEMNFVVFVPSGKNFDDDYRELISVLENKNRCFDECSEALENFQQLYIYFDGAKCDKYFNRFEL